MDNINWQDSNIFKDVPRGNGTVYVKDAYNCNPIEVEITIPNLINVITPNNDGANDSLDLNGFDVKKIEIYNRWGRLVFDKNNYTNEWYGQNNNGEKLPDGTYFYLITHSNLETINGWIFVNGN